MRRYVFCCLLIAAGVATSPAAAQTGKAAGCNGLPLFGSNDSLNTADLQVANKDLRIQVNTEGFALRLRLEPEPGWKPVASDGSTSDAVLRRVGWIRVFTCDSGVSLQSLEVESSTDPGMFLRFFEVKDVNWTLGFCGNSVPNGALKPGGCGIQGRAGSCRTNSRKRWSK
jgi:hypothetical protein